MARLSMLRDVTALFSPTRITCKRRQSQQTVISAKLRRRARVC